MTGKKKQEIDAYLQWLLGTGIYDPNYYGDPEPHSCASHEEVVTPSVPRKHTTNSREE